jgi:hypothetical protein
MFVRCVVCCKVEFSGRADHSSRGFILTVVHLCVTSRNLANEEVLAHWGAVVPKNKLAFFYNFCELIPNDGSLYRKVVTQGDKSE